MTHENLPPRLLETGLVSAKCISCWEIYADRWGGDTLFAKQRAKAASAMHLSEFKSFRRKIINPQTISARFHSAIEFTKEYELQKQAQPPFLVQGKLRLIDFLRKNLGIQRSYWSTEFETDLCIGSDFSRIVFSDNSKYNRDPEYLIPHFAGIIADIRNHFSKYWSPVQISFQGKLPHSKQLVVALCQYAGAKMQGNTEFTGLVIKTCDLQLVCGSNIDDPLFELPKNDIVLHPTFFDSFRFYLARAERVKSLTISTAAEKFGMHPKHLQRKLREFGTSFSDLRNLAFIEQSSKLLISEDASCFAIAESMGLSDAGVFSRSFHRHTGLRPSNLRTRR